MAYRTKAPSRDGSWYVPDLPGNRQDPDPFRVLLLPMSGSEIQELELDLARAHPGRTKADDDKRSIALVEEILRRRVVEVRGYEVEDPQGRVLRPRDGAELVKALAIAPASEGALVGELMGAIQHRSRMEAGLLERFSSPSGSSAAGTPA